MKRTRRPSLVEFQCQLQQQEQRIAALEQQLLQEQQQKQLILESNAEYRRQLTKIHRRNRELILNTHSTLWSTNSNGKMTEPQPTWQQLTGQSWETCQGLGWLQAVHPDDYERVKQEWKEAVTSQNVFGSSWKLWCEPLTSFRSVIARAAPIYNSSRSTPPLPSFRSSSSSSSPLSSLFPPTSSSSSSTSTSTSKIVQEWIGTCFDVTEIKQREEQLYSDAGYLKLALSSAEVGTWSWNIKEGNLVWDDHICPLFGIKPGTFGGTLEHFIELLHIDDRARVERECFAAIRRPPPGTSGLTWEYRVCWPTDGSLHILSSRGEVYYDEEGEPVKMTGICWDITDQRKAEWDRLGVMKEAAEQMQHRVIEAENYRSRLEDFTNTICHEIRNPLHGIIGSLEWLKEVKEGLTTRLRREAEVEGLDIVIDTKLDLLQVTPYSLPSPPLPLPLPLLVLLRFLLPLLSFPPLNIFSLCVLSRKQLRQLKSAQLINVT
jgi:PAS domain-containing protein